LYGSGYGWDQYPEKVTLPENHPLILFFKQLFSRLGKTAPTGSIIQPNIDFLLRVTLVMQTV